MRKLLFYKKLRLVQTFLLCLVLFSPAAFAQTTVVTQFNFNSSSTAFDPTVNNTVGLPFSIKLFNAANVQITPTIVGGMLQLSSAEEGSYIELEFNTTNFYDLNVDFDGQMADTIFGEAQWTLQEYNAVANSYTTLGSLAFGFLDYSGSLNRNLSVNANNSPSVKIRIVAETIDRVFFDTKLRLDNLVITSRSPKINLFGYNTTNMLQQIVVNAPAATMQGTDFGIVVTEDPAAATRTFRIKNSGTATLNISSMTFSGNNPGDFAWVTNPATPAPVPVPTNVINSLPTTINPNAYKEFILKFNPSAEGKRSALLNIFSNATPSPFSFFVEGRGATCTTEDLVLRRNTMETSQSVNELLTATPISSNFNKISGFSSATDSSSSNSLGSGFGTPLYCDVNTNVALSTTSNTSWFTSNDTSRIEFGAANVANEKGVYISFNLAAFSTDRSASFGNNDYVELQVLKPGTTDNWSKEIRIQGGNATAGSSRYSFQGRSIATTFYDGDDSAFLFTNGNNLASKYSKVQLRLPGSSNFENVIFRIVASNNSDAKLWLIDDVAVYSANAVFRTYKPDGTWRDSGDHSVSAPNEATQTYKNFKAIFDGNYTIPPQGLTVCECEVNNGASLTIPTNTRLTVHTSVTNLGNGNNFSIKDGGNLIQVEDGAINAGNVTAEKVFTFTVPPAPYPNRQQYNYVSSPVVGGNLKDIYAGSPATIYHSESSNMFYNSSGVNIQGRALGVKEPSTVAVAANTVTAKFVGVPFNGILDYPLSYTTVNNSVSHGYNLVGNPYPSNLDLVALYAANSARIESTISFWDNRGNRIAEQQGSLYKGQNYALLNAENGTSIAAASQPATQEFPVRIPSRYVSPAQGFMVRAKSTANTSPLKFSNALMRVAKPAEKFFGKSNSEAADRYWLQITTPTQIVYSAAVVYYDGGLNTVGHDDTYAGASSDNIFTIADETPLSIHGRPVFTKDDLLPLGYRAFQSGNYAIALQNSEGVFASGQNIYLKDKHTAIITNLNEGNYTFSADAGESTGRFEIIYKPTTILAVDSETKDELTVYRDGNRFVVKAQSKKITQLELFDTAGRLIYKAHPNALEAFISADNLRNGMYIIRIDQSGLITAKKIVR